MAKNSPSQPPQSGSSRRSQLRQQQEQAAKERKLRNIITFSIIGVAALAVVGTLAWVIISALGSTPTASDGVGSSGSSDEYTVQVGSKDAAVAVDIYQDYMCPYCGQFERANTDDLKAMADSGDVLLRIHPMSFLDDASQGSQFSTRAANALVTVAKAEPDLALAFNAALFANQPDEGTAGLSDAEIAEIARGAGVSNDTVATFARLANKSFVQTATTNAFANGVTGTPTVLINNEKFTGDLYTAGVLKTAVDEALAK